MRELHREVSVASVAVGAWGAGWGAARCAGAVVSRVWWATCGVQPAAGRLAEDDHKQCMHAGMQVLCRDGWVREDWGREGQATRPDAPLGTVREVSGPSFSVVSVAVRGLVAMRWLVKKCDPENSLPAHSVGEWVQRCEVCMPPPYRGSVRAA